MVQSGPNGPKWSKWSKVVQSDPNGPRWSKVVQMIQSGPRWSKVVQNYDMDFLSRNFRRVIFSGTPCTLHNLWNVYLLCIISVRIKASGNSCEIPMAVSTSYPRLLSPLSWCGEAFATRNIFTDGKFRAFERFWHGQRRNMWDSFTLRFNLIWVKCILAPGTTQ